MSSVDLNSARFRDQLLGCWLGKSIGGTLGTPLEQAWGQEEPFDVWWYPKIQEDGLPNDDLEMQLVWLAALEQVGPRLTARDLASSWLDHIGYNFDEYGLSKTNLRLGLEPPVSGSYNNWFIDCMGSPIRSEVWACAAPGAPNIAARYAFEDAICDHAGGEGVYGELFNAALESAAFIVEDKRQLLDIALSYVPPTCQTARAVHAAIEAHDEGVDWKTARKRVLSATPSPIAQYAPINLGFQTIGWLYGSDFAESLCITVNCGYDTDSSGGSVGAWLGIHAGRSGIPSDWAAPFTDNIATNESWGGVRHLTDSSTSVPTTLSDLTDRIIAVASRIASDGLEGGATSTSSSERDLYSSGTTRELWNHEPMSYEYQGGGVSVHVRYDNPVVRANLHKTVTTLLNNHHPDAVRVCLSLLVPPGWNAPDSTSVDVPAGGAVPVTWELPVPDSEHIANSNRLFLDVRVEGWPQQPAVPLVLVGARALRVAGPYPLDTDDEDELLEMSFPPEKPGEAPQWQDMFSEGNVIPTQEVLDEAGVAFFQTYLEAPEQVAVWLGVDCSHPTKCWLNGEELFTANRHRPIRPNYAGSKDGYTNTELRPGWNEVLIKVVRGRRTNPPECHLLVSTADKLHNGLPHVGITRLPDVPVHGTGAG